MWRPDILKAKKLANYRQIRMSDVIFASRSAGGVVCNNISNEKCYKTPTKTNPSYFATLLFLLETDIMAPVFIASTGSALELASISNCWTPAQCQQGMVSALSG